jgi:hypothetical protein
MPGPALDVGRRQFAHVLRVYIRNYNHNRPLDLEPPDSRARPRGGSNSKVHDLRVSRRDLLGGVIHEYDIDAAA